MSCRLRRPDRITLHRPQQLNALNDALIGAALQSFDSGPGISAIVITGKPKFQHH